MLGTFYWSGARFAEAEQELKLANQLDPRLVGANREYIDSRIPHLSALLADSSGEVMRHAEVCIIGSSTPEAIEALAQTNGRRVVDLVRLPDAVERRGREDYVGIAW